MLLTIHQPEHMPWLGFFDKMQKSETFIILDDVQYRKDYFQNRNKIVANIGEPRWITVTVEKSSFSTKINEKKIFKGSRNFPKVYKNLIYESYKHEKYFKTYSEELFNLIDNSNESLLGFNMNIINFFRKIFEINTPILFSSNLDGDGEKTDLNLSLCKKVGASEYLSGPAGKDYLDLESFKESNIKVSFHHFKQKSYLSKNYHPNLSSIDYLFRQGPNYFKEETE